ncbi:MAG: hypothetical protein LBV74_02370 [Tannerella sp.]|jgi:hypothetical protein|nr:hypothetical protein [Tannerella sp.]
MKQLLAGRIKWLLPVLFIGYISCISLFEHTHVVDGVIVTHSHPFKKGAHHDHQQNKLYIYHIQQLSTFSAEDNAVHTMHLYYHTSLITRMFDYSTSGLSSYFIQGKSFLRPPPVA